MPPLLHFEAEEIADGHALTPPCNYRLMRVTRCGTDTFSKRRMRCQLPENMNA